jgi:hypothetical protein
VSNLKHVWRDLHVLAFTQSQGASNPEEAIKSLCRMLIDEVGVDGPPFTPEIFTSFRGVVSVKRIPINEAGRLIPLKSGFEIEVNSGHTIEKQNFSINHEICHTFFIEHGSSRTKIDW